MILKRVLAVDRMGMPRAISVFEVGTTERPKLIRRLKGAICFELCGERYWTWPDSWRQRKVNGYLLVA